MKLAEVNPVTVTARPSRLQEKHQVLSWHELEMPPVAGLGTEWLMEAEDADLLVSLLGGLSLTESPAKQLFETLRHEWQEATKYTSSITEMVLHPAYQQIIGMGKQAIPMLLEELDQRPAHWFWALKAITREDPVPASSRGNVGEMVAAWIRWGRQRGYTV